MQNYGKPILIVQRPENWMGANIQRYFADWGSFIGHTGTCFRNRKQILTLQLAPHLFKTFHNNGQNSLTSHAAHSKVTWACSNPALTGGRQHTHSINYCCLMSTWVWATVVIWVVFFFYYSPISPWSFRSNSAYLSAKQAQEIITNSGSSFTIPHTHTHLTVQH